MWLRVGSRSSLIDDMGQVGMFGDLGSHYQPGQCVQRSGCSRRQTTRSGAALKMELYVPETMPMRSASAKPFKVSPPDTRIATRTRTTVKLVMIDRTAVCMMLRFTTWSKDNLWLTRRFSRTRSHTTMVSWTEKPTTVRTAVTKRLL